MQAGVPAGNIIITVFCLLIGLLVIFAQVFKTQLKGYILSKGWDYGPAWSRSKLAKRSVKRPDVERVMGIELI